MLSTVGFQRWRWYPGLQRVIVGALLGPSVRRLNLWAFLCSSIYFRPCIWIRSPSRWRAHPCVGNGGGGQLEDRDGLLALESTRVVTVALGWGFRVLFQIAWKGRKLEVKSICLRRVKYAAGGIDHPSEVYVPGAPQNSIQNLVCHALLFTYWASARVPWYATSKCIVFSDVWDPVLVCQAHLPGTSQVVTSTRYHIKVAENWPYFT